MKNIMSILSLVAVFIFSQSSLINQTRQSVGFSAKPSVAFVTDTLTVTGVCGMCKKRIETAAYGVKGIQSAKWSSKTQLLTFTFDNTKTSKEAIAKRIAMAGHDTYAVKASSKTYEKLPDCCRYRDGAACEH
jgi:periplasmic mercuric ion binding protein